MIDFNRLNGKVVFINPDLIRSVESTPDTILTLTDGDSLVIKETPLEVQQKFLNYKQQLNFSEVSQPSNN